MRLAVITINFNSSASTLKMLGSLAGQADRDFQTIVIDNASEEADFKNLKQGGGQAFFIRNKDNLGFSGGNNVGIRQALKEGADWVLLLNNDTWVEEGFIGSIRAILGQKTGILGLPLDEGGRVSYCGKIRWLKPFGHHVLNLDEAGKEKDKHIIGGGMLIHKNVFEKIGFLDEKYFLYFEDVDYSVKARNNNIPMEVLGEPVIHHSVSETTKKLGTPMLLRYHYRNALYFNFKNGPPYIKLLVLPWSLLILLKQMFKVFFMIRQEESIAIIKGVFDFYFNKMGKVR